MKEATAFSLGRLHPSSRMRLQAYVGRLEEAGWRLKMHHFDGGMGKVLGPEAGVLSRLAYRLRRGERGMRAARRLKGLDPREVIVISRELPVRRRAFLECPNPLVLDVDDAVYVNANRTGFDALCRKAKVVVCGNEQIAEDLAGVGGGAGRRVVIPTVVDTDLYKVRGEHPVAGKIRLGWLGSSMSLEFTLGKMMGVIGACQRALGFELVVISDEPPGFMREIPWVRYVRWSPEVECRVGEFFDIGIMPLVEDGFQERKCGAKLLQYMAAGLPVVASPVGVNRGMVGESGAGFLAGGAEEWRDALEKLSCDDLLRRKMGAEGRRYVEENYSVGRWVGKWVEVLEEAGGG